MKVVRTITVDGKTNSEYLEIVSYLEKLQVNIPGWDLIKEPVLNRVTAVKTEYLEKLE